MSCLLLFAVVSNVPPPTSVGERSLIGSEFVFPANNAPTPSCHASTLAELPDGRLIVAWFGGTSEPDIDTAIWLSRQTDDGWERPRLIIDGTEETGVDHRIGNPVLFRPADGPMMLFYKVVQPKPWKELTWWGMLVTSTDEGATWSPPRRLGRSPKLGSKPDLIGPVKNRPLEFADGSLLAPSSSEHDGWQVHFERSTDAGQSWTVIGPVESNGLQAIQPSLLDHGDGTLQAVCRTRAAGVLAETWSHDAGQTWSPMARMTVPNPNSGTDAITLTDGRHLLVYNHTTRRGEFPGGREMLNVAISDDGRDWRPVITLEQTPGREFSYPSLMQTADGLVHVTYTWNRESIRHVTIDPNEIE